MMDVHVLDAIPFKVDRAQLMKRLRLDERHGLLDDLGLFIAQAEAIARPKALYRPAFIDGKGDDYVVVEGIRLTSRVLRVNLERAHRLFAYIATCGTELQAWVDARADVLERYWGETIKEMALGVAVQAFNAHLTETYRLGPTSSMSPGSLTDWPLKEQRPLFAILGDPWALVGVRLTGSLLMIPTKTVSGVRFATEEHFESCQLCPRQDCPGRRAPYEADLYDRRYGERTE